MAVPVNSLCRVVLRAPNWVGDAVMALPTVVALRRALPWAPLTVLARPPLGVLFQAARDPEAPTVPLVEAIEEVPRHRGVRRLAAILGSAARIRRRLGRERSEALGVLLPNSFESALHMAAVGTAYRLGYARDGRRIFLRPAVPTPPADGSRHHCDYYLGLVAFAGLPADRTRPTIACPPRGEDEARALLDEQTLEIDGPLIALHGGAAFGVAKRWRPKRYADVARRIVGELDGRVVLIGTAGEEEELARWIAQRAGPGVVNLAGRTTLEGLMGLFARADLVVGNDSGPLHVAAALGRPTLSIFGPTNPYRTAPLGPRSWFVSAHATCSPCELPQCPIDHHCMGHITADRVVDGIAAILAQRPAPHLDRLRAPA